MRQLISGMVAAVAVMAASPAMACGYSSCSPCVSYNPCATSYVAPVATYSYGYGCGSGCGGWATQRLADPQQQYYYVNQGPTYTGPGSYAPVPTYSEGGSYSNYGYGYGRPYGHRYGYGVRPAVRYGYGARVGYGGVRFGYGGVRYGARHGYYGGGARYGMRHGAPYHYGRALRRHF